MKKIYLLILCAINLLVFCTISKRIFASVDIQNVKKTMIAEVGSIKPKDLEYEGYQIVSSNINFNRSGDYQVVYRNEETNNSCFKIVKLKDKKDLEGQISYAKTTNLEIGGITNGTFQKVIKDNQNNYYIAYINEVIIDQEELYDICVAKIYDNTIIYQKTIFEKEKGLIVDMLVDEDKLVILLEKEGTSKTNDVFLYILDDKGEILNFQQFIGSGINHAIKLLQDITSYYIVGETTSTDYDYNFSHKYRCGVVFIVDKEQPERFTYYSVIDENYDVTVNDACICDDKLYVSTTIYNKKIRARQLELYVFDNIRYEYYDKSLLFITLTKTLLKMSCDNNDQLVMVFEDYDEEKSGMSQYVYLVDQMLNKTLVYKTNCYRAENTNLVDFVAVDNNDYIFLYHLYNSKELNKYGYLYQVVSNNKVLFEIEKYSENDSIGGLVENNYDELIFNNRNSLKIDGIDYTYLNSHGTLVINNPSDTITLPVLYAGGEKCQINEEKSTIISPTSQFGSYIARYYFTNKDIEYIYIENIRINPYCNLRDKGLYDTDVKINFNGTATLNHQSIESGYEISKPGSYTLELKGKDDEKFEINFDVANISNREIIEDDIVPEIEEIKTRDDKEIKKAIIEESIDLNDIKKKNKNNLWYVLLPIAFAIAFVLVLKKR